ncbi:MAG TPA: GNAT family N-acetyltransferase [Ktedonobacterales bacterium]|nr:GNAT family N-acetyltransferase [Ktedonobacterales bacterium]
MRVLIRPLRQGDEPFLWQMLFYAAHLQDEGETSFEAAKTHPELRPHVSGWGRKVDLGALALHPQDQHPLGAAWIRVLREEQQISRLIAEGTPELVIAVLPESRGQGIGTQLLTHLLKTASQVYPAVVLSVRKSNPARALYERMGFEIVDTVCNRVGSESLVMLRRFARQGTNREGPIGLIGMRNHPPHDRSDEHTV